MTTISERIDTTEAWLDATIPGWDRQIDLAVLDMASWRHCLGGQIAGGYIAFASKYDLGNLSEIAAGLNGEHPDEYLLLTAAWRERIAARRMARLTPEPEAVAV